MSIFVESQHVYTSKLSENSLWSQNHMIIVQKGLHSVFIQSSGPVQNRVGDGI